MILLVPTISQISIGGTLEGTEILHGDMQLLQSGGDVGCGFLPIFYKFFPLF